MKAYLEGEVIRSTSRCTIDLDCTRFHGITDHDGLVNIPGKDAALRPTYPETILLYWSKLHWSRLSKSCQDMKMRQYDREQVKSRYPLQKPWMFTGVSKQHLEWATESALLDSDSPHLMIQHSIVTMGLGAVQVPNPLKCWKKKIQTWSAKLFALQWWMPSSIVLIRITGNTGPKGSSQAIRMSGRTWSIRSGQIRLPSRFHSCRSTSHTQPSCLCYLERGSLIHYLPIT